MTYMGIWLGNRPANFHNSLVWWRKKPGEERERGRGREGGFKLVSMFCLSRRHWDTSVTGLLREPVLRHTHGRLKSIQDLILASSSSTHLNSIFAIASFSIWYCRRSYPPLWAENILWQKVVFSVFRVDIDEVSLEHNVEDLQQPLHTHMSICLCVFLCSPVWSPTPSIDSFIHSRFLGFLFLRLNLC